MISADYTGPGVLHAADDRIEVPLREPEYVAPVGTHDRLAPYDGPLNPLPEGGNDFHPMTRIPTTETVPVCSKCGGILASPKDLLFGFYRGQCPNGDGVVTTRKTKEVTRG